MGVDGIQLWRGQTALSWILSTPARTPGCSSVQVLLESGDNPVNPVESNLPFIDGFSVTKSVLRTSFDSEVIAGN